MARLNKVQKSDMYYNNWRKYEVSSPEFWEWFDQLPKESRDKLNNARTADEFNWLYQAIVYEIRSN